MCGICGLASTHGAHPEAVEAMLGAISHRGPDGRGIERCDIPNTEACCTLGHARLAIIDVSERGRQPLHNEDGTVRVICNGEIYNFEALRRELEAKGHRFSSDSDSEVLVHLYEEHGEAAFARLQGMFAFALLDIPRGRLFLARDGLGIKPLYYSAERGQLLFASEIKSILASGHRPRLDWQSVADYFTFLYVPCPATMFAGIRQLLPGHWLRFDLPSGETTVRRFWSVERDPDIEQADEHTLCARLRASLDRAIAAQLRSDVPLGVFLSGGIDSAIVAGLARRHGPVRTFTAVFADPAYAYYDESAGARHASQHLGTEHLELPIDGMRPDDLLDLVAMFDQPFGNPTALLMHRLSRAAREHVTVALCGAGGDELYAGYPRHRALRIARSLGWVPEVVIDGAQRGLGLLRDSHTTMRLRRVRRFLAGLRGDDVSRYLRWVYFLQGPRKRELLSTPYDDPERVLRRVFDESPLGEADNRLAHVDVATFLLDNILEYSDKASMAVALELRVPLLDESHVNFALNVPYRFKLRGMQSKWLLRRAFADVLPPTSMTAPKRGFNAPLAQWIRGDLDGYFRAADGDSAEQKRWGDEAGQTWAAHGALNGRVVAALREEHREGRADNAYELFSIIMFDAWWRRFSAMGLEIDA